SDDETVAKMRHPVLGKDYFPTHDDEAVMNGAPELCGLGRKTGHPAVCSGVSSRTCIWASLGLGFGTPDSSAADRCSCAARRALPADGSCCRRSRPSDIGSGSVASCHLR